MVDFHKLKNLGTDILGRAGEFAEQAKDKVGPLAEQAKDKVGPLAEQAKDRVGPLAGKAKDAAAKGVDTATGHKFHDKLGDVTGNREKNPPPASSGPNASVPADDMIEDAVIVTDDVPPSEPTGTEPTSTDPAGAGPTSTDTTSSETISTEAEGRSDETSDAANDQPAAPELVIIADDGSEHHPTPSDMPPHRPDTDPS